MRGLVRAWVVGLAAVWAVVGWAQDPPADVTPPVFMLEGVSAEAGQPVEGCGSASFSWMCDPGVKLGVAFAAPKTGTISKVTLQWKCSSGYGEGNFGRYTFALQTDGPGHLPSGVSVGMREKVIPATAMGGQIDGALTVLLKANVTAGTIYHLVIKNTDPDPAHNYSSPNTLMTRGTPWDGTGSDCAVYLPSETGAGGAWGPWSSINNLFNTGGTNAANGSHCPLMLTWADGTTTGDPYYSAAVKSGAYLWGDNAASEYLVWDQPTADVCGVGLSVGRLGTPGALRYHIADASGAEIAAGQLAPSGPGDEVPAWVHADLPAPMTLTCGQAYRLWFDSPDSPDAENCFYQHVPYGEATPTAWLESGWGGTASCFADSADGGATWAARPTADMTFGLRVGSGAIRTAVSVEQTSPTGASLTLPTPSATDETDPHPTVTGDATATFPPGVTTVTWTARDATGNTSTLAVTVTVADTIPPSLIPPPDVTVTIVTGTSAAVALGIPTAQDGADPHPTVTHNAPATFPLGATTVTWTVTDAAGHRTTATQQVTVALGFAITRINPASFSPRNREKTSISYTMPRRAACRIVVRNSAGALVKQLDTDSTGSSSDTGSTSWDGKDAQKRNVVAGTYTITVESTKADGLVAASGTVVVR